MKNQKRIMKILRTAKVVARQYHELTGKPLGITGEVAEYEASRLLKITLTPARTAGWDAVEKKHGVIRRLQIKGRVIFKDSKLGQRLGRIQIKKKWDAILMVILDRNFNAVEIHEATRKNVVRELAKPGSKTRNERGALGINKFKSIGTLRWPKEVV